MIMADVFTIVSIILGFLLGINALLLLCRGLWLQDTIYTAELCSQGLLENFLWGLLPTMFSFVLVLVGGSLGAAGKIIIPVIICLFLMYASVGLSGFVSMLGGTLLQDNTSVWKSTLFGSVIFTVSCILPVLGWFILLPIAIIIASGARLRLGNYRKKNINTIDIAEV